MRTDRSFIEATTSAVIRRMITPAAGEITTITGGGHQADAVHDGRACFKWNIVCLTNDNDPCISVPFEFGMKDTAEKVVKEVFMRPWGGEDKLVMSCGQFFPRDANFTLEVRDWVYRSTVMCSKPLEPAQELGSVFPNGPPSMRNPGVIDFVVIDKNYATEVKHQRSRDIEQCAWTKSPPSPWTKLVRTWLDRDFGKEFKEDVLHIHLNERESMRVGIERGQKGSHHIFVRSTYRELFERLERFGEATGLASRACRGIVVSGQPGTGKTTFLWFMFLCCVMKKYPIMMFTGTSGPVLVDGGIVYRPGREPPMTPRYIKYALADTDKHSGQRIPTWFLEVPIIQTSFPNPNQFAWAADGFGRIWGMPLWDKEELVKAASIHRSYDGFVAALRQMIEERKTLEAGEIESIIAKESLNFDDIPRVTANAAYSIALAAAPDGAGGSAACLSTPEIIFNHALDYHIGQWGPIPRDVFTAIFMGNVILLKEIEAAMSVDAGTTFQRLLRSGLQRETEYILIRPPSKIASALHYPYGDLRWSFSQNDIFLPEFRSDWVAERVTSNTVSIDQETLVGMRRLFDEITETSTMQGWIFQKIAFNVLSKQTNLGKLRVVKMVLQSDPSEDAIPESPDVGSETEQGGEVQGTSTEPSTRKRSGRTMNMVRAAKRQRFEELRASDTLPRKRSGMKAKITVEQRSNTAPAKRNAQEAASRPSLNHSMKSDVILPTPAIPLTEPLLSANLPVLSGSVLVPPPEVEGSHETIPSASTSSGSSDKADAVAVKRLKFSTPPDLEKDPSGDGSATQVPFRLLDREICLVRDSKSPFEPPSNLDSLGMRIYTPAVMNHPLFDGFIVDFPDVWFIRVTRMEDHDGAESGCPIIASILSKVQNIANQEAAKKGKKEKTVTVRAKFLLVNELPFCKRSWALPCATEATNGDVYCLHVSEYGDVPYRHRKMPLL